ncbi:MAG: hypothetical protein MSA56_06255 [Clostridium sp.]|nr:hypothetical protein [Clostridium sp.]
MEIIKGNNIEEIINKIISIYQNEEVVLGELISNIYLVDCNIEEVVEIYKKVRLYVDGIIVEEREEK